MALTEAEVQARQQAEADSRSKRLADLQFAKQIEETFGVPYLLQKLEEYPEAIRHQQEAIKAADQIVAEAREEVEYQEAILRAEIASAVNPSNGKPAYSNEESRKAEFICRKKISEPYQRAASMLKTAEDALQTARFDYDKLVNEFSSARAMSKVTAGRLGLVGK